MPYPGYLFTLLGPEVFFCMLVFGWPQSDGGQVKLKIFLSYLLLSHEIYKPSTIEITALKSL